MRGALLNKRKEYVEELNDAVKEIEYLKMKIDILDEILEDLDDEEQEDAVNPSI